MSKQMTRDIAAIQRIAERLDTLTQIDEAEADSKSMLRVRIISSAITSLIVAVDLLDAINE